MNNLIASYGEVKVEIFLCFNDSEHVIDPKDFGLDKIDKKLVNPIAVSVNEGFLN